MIQSPLSVATDGYICNSPSRPLSIWTRGYLCLILIVDAKSGVRRLGFAEYWKDMQHDEEMEEIIKQIAEEDEEMLTILMLSMIYGLLE